MLISDPSSRMRWTSSSVVNMIRKYVHPTSCSKIEKVLNKFDIKKEVNRDQFVLILKDTIESSNGALTLYEPAELFFNDLIHLNNFPKNNILFEKGDEMNYLAYPVYLMDHEDREFMSKPDVFLALITHINKLLDGKRDNGLYKLLVKSFGNRVGRQLKGSFEIVPMEVVDSVLAAASETFGLAHTMQTMKRGPKSGLRMVNYSLEEVYKQFAEFYDDSNDEHLLNELKSTLDRLMKSTPLKSSPEWYNQAYMLHMLIYDSIGTISNRHPVAFQPYSKIKKTVKKHTPSVRLFLDNDEKFLFAKEVEVAISMALKNKSKNKTVPSGIIVIETQEERLHGFLYSISWNNYLNALKKCGLAKDDIAVIEETVKRTSRKYATPIASPYGSHCKLASDAFFELFDHIAFGMYAFQNVKPENVVHLDEWFGKLRNYFQDSKKLKYFIDCKSIDSLIQKAYSEISPLLSQPGCTDMMTGAFTEKDLKNPALKESKLVRIFPDIVDKITTAYNDKLKQTKKDHLSHHDILSIQDISLKMSFFTKYQKYAKFFHHQGSCYALRKFPCECRNVTEKKNVDDKEINKVPLKIIEQKNITLELIEDNLDDLQNYKIVSRSGEKFCTNQTAIVLCVQRIMKNIQSEYLEIVTPIVSQMVAQLHDDAEWKVFHMTENEMQEIANDFEKKFIRAYTHELNKVIAHANAQMHEVPWEDICTNFEVFLPESRNREWCMTTIKKEMSVFKESTATGVNAFLMCKIFTACRQAHCFFIKMKSRLQNLEAFMSCKPDRIILMRMMSCIKVEGLEAMFVFTDEVVQVVKILLKQEKRWSDEIQDRLEQYEHKWRSTNGFSTIPVMQVTDIMDDIGVPRSKILIIPDADYLYRRMNFPLQMGYVSMQVRGPGGESCMNVTQAQYHIFQYVCCDVLWTLEKGTCTNHAKCSHGFKQEIIERLRELSEIEENTYILVDTVIDIVKKLQENVVYEETKFKKIQTPFTMMHDLSYAHKVSKKEYLEYVCQIIDICERPKKVPMVAEKFLTLMGCTEGLVSFRSVDAWRVRYVFMKYWIDSFLNDEKKLICDITKAWTLNMSHVNLETMDHFKDWFSTMGKYPNKYVDFGRIKICEDVYRKTNRVEHIDDLMDCHMWASRHYSSDFDNDSSDTTESETHQSAKTEAEKLVEPSKPTTIDTSFSFLKRGFLNRTEVVKKEDLKKIEVNQLTKSVQNKNGKTQEERVKLFIDRLLRFMPRIINVLAEEEVYDLEELHEILCEELNDDFREEDKACMDLVRNGEQICFKLFEENLRKFFNFQYVEGDWKLTIVATAEQARRKYKKGKQTAFGGTFSNIHVVPNIPIKLNTMSPDELQKTLINAVNNAMKITDSSEESESGDKAIARKKKKKEAESKKKIENQPKLPTSTKIVEFCQGCKKTKESLDESKKEISNLTKTLKATQKKNDSSGKTLKEKESETSVLKSQIAQIKQSSRDEIKKLKDEISKKDKSIVALRQQFKLEEEKESLWRIESEQVYGAMSKQLQGAHEINAKLEEKLKEAKKTETRNAEQISLLTFQNNELNSKNEDAMHAIGELQKNNKQWQNMLAEKDNTISAYHARVRQFEMSLAYVLPQSSMLSPPLASPAMFPLSPSMTNQVYRSQEVQSKLEEFENILDEMECTQIIPQARAIFVKFSDLSKNMLEVEAAANEFGNFEEQYNSFIQTLRRNIMLINENIGIGISDLAPLPELLPFSFGFMRAYEKCSKKLPKSWDGSKLTDSQSSEKEIDDPECLICTIDIEQEQRTTKCESCSRRYHTECVSAWLKKNSICPVCRSALPDPKEYPVLN